MAFLFEKQEIYSVPYKNPEDIQHIPTATSLVKVIFFKLGNFMVKRIMQHFKCKECRYKFILQLGILMVPEKFN